MKRAAAPLSLVLVVASLWFFYQCVRFVSRREYVGAILVMFVGFAVMRGASELFRLALQDRGSR